jgi:hypothetical protein
MFTIFRDQLKLPDFSGEANWTSSLRERAGFAEFTGSELESSDFTYHDKDGVLTRYFQQMQHPYSVPAWLNTVFLDGSAPLYHLEVKSTTSQDATTPFYISGNQHELVCTQILSMKHRDGVANLEIRQKSGKLNQLVRPKFMQYFASPV